MADNTSTAKHSPTKANSVITDLKNNSALRTRRTVACAYGFTFAFVLCTAILVFNPSAAYSSPWFPNVFRTNSDPSSSSSYGSHFSSIFSYFFPQTLHSPPPFSAPLENTHNISTPPNTTFQFSRGEEGVSNGTKDAPSQFSGKKEGILDDNKNTTSHNFSSPPNTTIQFSQGKGGVSNGTRDTPSQFSGKKEGILDDKNTTSHNFSNPPNTTIQFSRGKGWVSNGTKDTPSQFSGKKEALLDGSKGTTSHNFSSSPNTTSLFSRGKGGVSNGTKETPSQFSGEKEGFLMSREGINRSGSGDWKAKPRKEFDHCDIFDGKWVKDDLYPLYEAGSCPHIDEPFNCFLNGRPDAEYQKYRWQPNDCNIPRLNGRDMLGLLRGKRLVFVGDSLNRNMWESLVCILRNSARDKSRVFEASGRREFRTEGSYSFVFVDYNCSVEFFRSPFLVQEWEMADTNGSTQETLRLDVIERSSDRYKTADVLIFNTGHWWTHEKTSKGKGYYQEGSHIYGQLNVAEAFRKAMTTWARWVDANINPLKTLVFFRGYSASHFRGGRWNSGGQCDSETEPIKNETYLAKYPSKMRVLESVMKEMKTPVFYLNITRITDYRKDAHPSIFRKQSLTEEERRSPLRYQDCSHWCLPGVPDTWNELLYAQLLIKHNQKVQNQQQQQQKRP